MRWTDAGPRGFGRTRAPLACNRRRIWAAMRGGCVAFVFALLTLAPARAEGYVHTWNCASWYAYDQCFDLAGQRYNAWEYVQVDYLNGIGGGTSVNGTCAKAITAAQNIRSGSGCSSSLVHYANIAGGYPTSWAYVYWGGNGQVSNIGLRAGT